MEQASYVCFQVSGLHVCYDMCICYYFIFSKVRELPDGQTIKYMY